MGNIDSLHNFVEFKTFNSLLVEEQIKKYSSARVNNLLHQYRLQNFAVIFVIVIIMLYKCLIFIITVVIIIVE